jgi:protein phosphatase methylesterase 1
LLGVISLSSSAPADTDRFVINDDPSQTSRMQGVIDDWIATRSPRSGGINYANVTLLLPETDGSWTRIGVNQDTITYPASCVKLPFMMAAMYWERTNGHPVGWIDANFNNAVTDMIVDSSNIQTGVVVDVITDTPNRPDINNTSHPDWNAWYTARLYTEDWLTSVGLLGNQTIVNKTYPTNSGNSPQGAEAVSIFDFRGSNQMNPRLSASMMLDVVKGGLEPRATGYMRSLLRTDRWDDDSSIGFGLPPGTIYENKIGVALGTSEDIAYIRLPNGNEAILAIYTDSHDTAAPIPYDVADIGMLAELILQEWNLLEGNPPQFILDNTDATFNPPGEWQTGTSSADKFGPDYRFTTNASGGNRTATWKVDVTFPGTYEIAIRWPQGTNRDDGSRWRVFSNGSPVTGTMQVNQKTSGGRWYRLADVDVQSGELEVRLQNNSSPSNEVVLADAVKITAHDFPPVPAPGLRVY